MANLLALDYNDPPELTRALINEEMNADVANMKKRKFFGGSIGESSLPAPKHKCCEVAISSECESSITKAYDEEEFHIQINNGANDMALFDTEVESAQECSTFPSDALSSAGSKFTSGFGEPEPYVEASTSLSNYGSEIFINGEQYPRQDTGCHDIDCLEECVSSECFEDGQQPTAEGLEEFLYSSGINPTLYALSSERWSHDQETQLGRAKPTIDQEFEQYFSTLML